MEFFVIAVVWGILQIRGSGCPLRYDRWFDRWAATLNNITNQPVVLLPIIIGLPSIGVLILYLLFESLLLGLLQLALSIAVLFYSVGRKDLNGNMQYYLDQWDKGNIEAATETLNDDEYGDDKHLNIIIEGVEDDYVATHEHRRQSLFYEGYERWFAAAFWFLLLGPAGALAYRLSILCNHTDSLNDDQQRPALKIIHYLDWIPARLLAFSFNVTGNFVSGFSRWLELVLEDHPIAALLDNCGCAALNNRARDDYPTKQDAFISFGREQLLAAQALLSRSVIAWLVMIAIIQLW